MKKIMENTTHIQKATSPINVSTTERFFSGLIGAGLSYKALQNFRRGSTIKGAYNLVVGSSLLVRAFSGRCALYRSLGVDTAGPQQRAHNKGVKVEKSIVINRPAADLYNIWHHLENLPRIMRHLKDVRSEGTKSHWVASAPLKQSVEWDAEIIKDQENELIAWKSLENSEVYTAGSVRFKEMPRGQGTQLKVNLKYDLPGGPLGVWAAKLFGHDPAVEIEEDLSRFKHAVESPGGEGLLR